MQPTEDKYRKILRKYWGFDDFRGIQREIIDSICSGRDTLGLMPTGGGKSLTFQVPALAMEGVCIVITPLIALMKDQVVHLRRHGIRAAAVYGSMMHNEIIATLENCIFGGIDLLYVSPERLSSELFQTKLKHMKVSFITVDEAHCISQWGYDFRPSYLKIADIRKLKPDVPILALTATATPQVTDDIQERLAFKEKNVFKMSFERKNLAYIVRRTADKQEEMVHILNSVGGSAIVYVRSRKRSKEISGLLNKSGISSTFYNAGLDHVTRDSRQTEWQNDRVRVMVATNAFGMGIDKPDVRVVIHIDCPDSIEAYFQEAGRAGRDGKKAYAVLLYNNSDNDKLEKRINENFPEKDYIKKVYEHLAYYYQIGMGSGMGHKFEFNIDKFCYTFKHFPIQVDSSLKILTRAGYIDYEEDSDTKARVRFLLSRNELYRLNTLSEKETAVITALLRTYGGLFTDYVYTDEALIAQITEMEKPQIYMVLKNLSERSIIHFIPRKKIPHITYVCEREETERLVIAPEVYEERKEQFRKRIHAMLDYARTGYVCRSRQLLRYFGEERSSDCGQCDVCIDCNKRETPKKLLDAAEKAITDILKDRRPHSASELNSIKLERDVIGEALQWLVSEEKIYIEDGMISLW